jgi:spore germination protein GerM
MSRALLRCGLLIGALLLAAACGVSDQDRAQVEDDEAVPFDLLDPNVPPLLPSASAAVTEDATLCFVRDDELVVVGVPLETPVSLDDVVEALMEPPDVAGSAVRTAVGAEPLVGGVRLSAGVARVDLLPAIEALVGDEQLLAVAQLVCTLSSQPGVGPVAFTLEGSPVDVPRGDGSLTSEPVSRDDYSDLLG